ncbi:hypothetical protein MCEMSEM23_00443 [Rhabdaerophilaceae bacterium]
MTYLPLTCLIAAAGGVVLPLMAEDAVALPTSRTFDSFESQPIAVNADPRGSSLLYAGNLHGQQQNARKEVDK